MRSASLIDGLKRRQWPVFLGLVLLGSAIYIGWARWQAGSFGYPLDDAWIHQVFARNIALRGEFGFNPGESSSGSTSPFWTLLLAIGYFLPGGYFPWSLALGMVSLFLTGVLASHLTRIALPSAPGAVPLTAGVLTVTNWYLVWTALSGMETVFFTALTLLLVVLYYRRPQGLLIGLLGALVVMVRPEGLLLFAASIAGLLWQGCRAGETDWKQPLLAILAFALLIAPYFAFNLAAAGAVLPSTAGAKMAIYGSGLSLQSLANFLLRLSSFYLLAPTCLILIFAVLSVKNIRSLPWLPFVWVLLFVGAYALTLRAFFNWGRYFIPLAPWVILYGVWGLYRVTRGNEGRLKLYLLANVVLFLAFWAGEARTYAMMVEDVNKQQVNVGKWLGENTPGDGTIAAWDIGAVGYFSHRRVVDLGGLITPEVVNYVRRGEDLTGFLEQQRTDYVVQFTGNWKEKLPQATLEKVLSYEIDIPTHFGGDVVSVYRVTRWPK